MALRVARGLFRLWIVGTALFVLVIAFISYSDIKREFDAVATIPTLEGPSSILASFRQRHPLTRPFKPAKKELNFKKDL